MTTEEKIALSIKLWRKYMALKTAKSALNDLPPDERPNYEAARQNIQTEMDFTMAVITNLGRAIPMAFPSEAEIAGLQAAAGELEGAVAAGAAATTIVQVAGRVINTWPASAMG